jgi:hypothetical protein
MPPVRTRSSDEVDVRLFAGTLSKGDDTAALRRRYRQLEDECAMLTRDQLLTIAAVRTRILPMLPPAKRRRAKKILEQAISGAPE